MISAFQFHQSLTQLDNTMPHHLFSSFFLGTLTLFKRFTLHCLPICLLSAWLITLRGHVLFMNASLQWCLIKFTHCVRQEISQRQESGHSLPKHCQHSSILHSWFHFFFFLSPFEIIESGSCFCWRSKMRIYQLGRTLLLINECDSSCLCDFMWREQWLDLGCPVLISSVSVEFCLLYSALAAVLSQSVNAWERFGEKWCEKKCTTYPIL